MERRTEFWIIGGFVLVIVLVVIAATLFSSNTAAPASFVATTVPAITADDHTQGDATSTVSVIEYGDFECPACGAYEPLVEQLENEYDNRVEFVFRNFPLYQIHPFAMIGAEAAEAANLQGKYWDMHNLLYTDQTQWTADTSLSPADVVSKYFDTYAQQLGLNVTQFNTDINSAAVQARVQRDLDSGNAASVDHTPTFFINLTQIPNPTNLAQFEGDINDALAGEPISTSTTEVGTSTASTGSPQASAQ